MLRGDAGGRIPFALVAVFLLLSSGLAALYAARLNGDEADRRLQEARLDALARVAEAIHEEVQGQAQQVALRAIVLGTDGIVNETRIAEGFRDGFREYVQTHFPRVVRTIRVDVAGYAAEVRLLPARTEDIVPSNATRPQRIGNGDEVVANDSAPDVWTEVERVAYHAVVGWVNYTLAMDGADAARLLPLRVVANAPIPLIAAKLEQTQHLGLGDFAGIGRIVKSVLTTLVQFRVLSGWASPMALPGTTTTRDILTTADVELALNLGLLLEEVRQFRTFDPEAALAADGARGTLPSIPGDVPPTAPARGLIRLLETYAANGTIDAVDLYAIYTGLDACGIDMASVLAQAIAGIREQLELKMLDYLGLTPLADFFNGVGQWVGEMFDGFLRWLGGRPSRHAEYVRGYVRAIFVDTGVGTGFLGAQETWIPERTYAIGSVNITIPAHAYTVAFPVRDLLSSGTNDFWDAYYDRLNGSLRSVGTSLHSLVDDFAVKIGALAVLAGLLPGSASGPIDPKDETSLMAALGARILRAVDDAIAWVSTDPGAIDVLMSHLWETIRATLQGLVDYTVASYDGLAGRGTVVEFATTAMATDLLARAREDPDFASLDLAGQGTLQAQLTTDASGWASAAFEARKTSDLERWRDVALRANAESFRTSMRLVVTGAGGWLGLARGMIRRTIQEDIDALDVASLRAVVPTRMDLFALTDPADPSRVRLEAFRVRQSPAFLRNTGAVSAGGPRTGELRIEIADPTTVPVSEASPNVHYTDPSGFSFRPYLTTWSVRVEGAVRLRVETSAGIVVGPEGLEPAALEAVVPLDFAFSVAASSGWGLAGVAYQNSNSFLHDVVALASWFLEQAWSLLSGVIRPILDALRRAARILLELVEPILRFANDVVRFLVEVASGVVDLLRGLVRGVNDFLALLLETLAGIPRLVSHFLVRVGALVVDVLVDPERGTRLSATIQVGALSLWLKLVNLPEAGLAAPERPEWDVLGGWSVGLHPFHLSASFDPVLAVQGAMLQGAASWEGSWDLDLAGPVAESWVYVGKSWSLVGVDAPGGAANLEVGVRAVVPPDLGGLVHEVIGRSYEQAVAEVGGEPRSLGAFGHFLRSYARHLLDNAADTFDRSFQVQIFVRASAVGKGFSLAFVAEGRAVREFFSWLARNALTFAQSWLDPLAPAEYEGLPPAVMENVWIWADLYFSMGVPSALRDAAHILGSEVRAAATIRANVPAIGALLGKSWGAWAVQFGAFVEVKIAELEVVGFFGAGDLETLWLLRGTIRAY